MLPRDKEKHWNKNQEKNRIKINNESALTLTQRENMRKEKKEDNNKLRQSRKGGDKKKHGKILTENKYSSKKRWHRKLKISNNQKKY